MKFLSKNVDMSFMGKAFHRLWANMSIFLTGLAVFSTVIPRFASRNFPDYDFRWGWVAWAVAGGSLAMIATFVSPRKSRWRLTAAATCSTYFLFRALYVELAFPELAPYSNVVIQLAMASLIAWSWGRPPIIRKTIRFPHKG